ncbi:MAG: NAD-dependent epimerase/dehydratase family protein [Chloroflexi bacterium]|nr:NAD-dependent epimerase/dehydratase family protein [Chloroflexota bacterium]
MQLVTGATGHIGNVLVRQLLAQGKKVRTLVRPSKTPLALQDLEVEIVPGDILDPDSLVRALDRVDVVYHLAARISLDPGPDPEPERVNLAVTRNLLAAARRPSATFRGPRFVYASTIYAMRPPEEGLVDESLPFDPEHARGVYDRSKAAASLEVQQAAADGLDALLVCPTAVAGPYDFQRSEAGRGILYHLPPGVKFTVDGAYDFVDVRDVANGLIAAAERGLRGETYILGGDRLTVREVAEAIWEAAGGWHVGVHLPDWVADLAASVLPFFTDDPLVTPYSLAAIRSNSHISHSKASRELGFRPRPARQAIVDAVRWWQEQRGELLPVPETIAKAAA